MHTSIIIFIWTTVIKSHAGFLLIQIWPALPLTCVVLWWHSLWAACTWRAWLASSRLCRVHQQEPEKHKRHKNPSQPTAWKQGQYTDQSAVHHNAYSVLVDDIYDGHQLASMGSERDVGNTADLNEAFEHLKDTRDLQVIKIVKQCNADKWARCFALG